MSFSTHETLVPFSRHFHTLQSYFVAGYQVRKGRCKTAFKMNFFLLIRVIVWSLDLDKSIHLYFKIPNVFVRLIFQNRFCSLIYHLPVLSKFLHDSQEIKFPVQVFVILYCLWSSLLHSLMRGRNGDRRRKWTRWSEFKSYMWPFAFHLELIHLDKIWSHVFSSSYE